MASNNNTFTTTFRADISQFSDSITSLQRYIRTVNSEFKVATKGASDWGKSQDGLKAKIEQLSRVLQAQEAIIAELEKEYRKVAKEQGENSEAAQKLTIEINKYKASISKTKGDIDKYNKSLDKMVVEGGKGEKGLTDLEKATKKAGDGFTVAKGAIAGFIANGLTALAGAAKNAISSVLGLADATREYRTTLATLDSASQDAGVSTDFVRDKFTDMMGVFNDEDSVTEGLNNLLTAGFDESSLDDITTSLEGAALKWKDTLKFEGLADSLQEWIGSGGESLTGNFAELLERMGYNLDEVKEKTEGMTAEQRRTYATNLLAAEGLDTVSEEYRKQNANMVEAQKANVNYQNAVAEMGAKIEPVTTTIREGFTKIVEKMLELVNGVDLNALSASIASAFDYFINTILPAIVSGLQWIIDNKDIIVAGIVAVGAAFVAWKVVGIVTAAINAIKNMSVTMKALNAVMRANVIGIVITAITALVAAFVYLWNNCEGFRKFWQNLWETIKTACQKAWNAIVGFFKNAWASIKKAWAGAVQWFKNLWEGIKNAFQSVGTWFANIFQKAWTGIKNAWSGVTKFFSNIWTGIKNAFGAVGSWFKNIFSSAVNGIKSVWKGITGFFSGLWTGIKNGAKSAVNGIISLFESGLNAVIKLINSITGGLSSVWTWAGIPAIPKIPTVSIPRLAKGGVVDTATLAQIGEAGKEAVIPLERNTQGLDLIAEKMADKLKSAGLGGMNVTYNNNFTNMPTTRYAMRKAMADSRGMYQLISAMQGGA